jgi:sec-independent protein translocase protein TatC
MSDNKGINSYFSHLKELRSRVIFSLIFFLITFIVSYIFSDRLLSILIKPLTLTNFPPKKIIYTDLTEAFITHFKLAFVWSLLVSCPFFLYQFYSFIAPGLYKKEKRAILPFFILGTVLFIISGYFTYYFIFPNAWNFFTHYQSYIGSLQLEFMPKIIDYVNLSLQFIIIFGLIFQLPLIIIILAKVGVLDSKVLKKFRRVFLVIAFIFGAVFTPPDIFSQIALAIPIILLYEVSILYLCYVERGNKKNA